MFSWKKLTLPGLRHLGAGGGFQIMKQFFFQDCHIFTLLVKYAHEMKIIAVKIPLLLQLTCHARANVWNLHNYAHTNSFLTKNKKQENAQIEIFIWGLSWKSIRLNLYLCLFSHVLINAND